TRTVRATLEDNNRLVVECDVSLPESAPSAVRYDAMELSLQEGDLAFEGFQVMGRFAYYANRDRRRMQLGKVPGYVVYVARDVDLHVFMPRSFMTPGICEGYLDGALHRFTLYSEVDNAVADEVPVSTTNWFENVLKGNAGEWRPVPGAVAPGQTRHGRFHVALFRQPTRRTIGRIDLEDRPTNRRPLAYINTSGTGSGESQRLKDASFRYTTRDKLLFMGVRLPSPRWDKPGHMMNDSPWLLNQPGVVDRLQRAGFGAVCLMMRDFVDVSHGISHEGDYNTAPPWLEELLDKLTAVNIRPVIWFSPNGFLNQKWKQRPPDPLVHEHPEWFRKSASWAGRYQNSNGYRKGLDDWITDKLRSDFRRFPQLAGVAWDVFPTRGTFVDVDEATGRRVPFSQLEIERLQRYHDVIRAERPDAWLMKNHGLPLNGEGRWVDFGVSEGAAKQMMNELQPGGCPFGRVHCANQQWTQLYHWMVTLTFMHHNFANFDQGLGWFHHIWIGWHPHPKYRWMRKAKDLDAEVVPLWYLMGKGRRMYVAETGPRIKQTEVRMPDGGIRIVVSSFSPWAKDIDVVPRHLPAGAYRVSGTIDTCLEHREIEAFDADTAAQAIRLTRLPGYGIAVLRFDAPTEDEPRRVLP
ncbi:MAG: hypothetical protein JW741_25035, partial [Sedimentisphaerales bacterium]|nr:hypothetical protein [Sedimentisphaerales bacterium]